MVSRMPVSRHTPSRLGPRHGGQSSARATRVHNNRASPAARRVPGDTVHFLSFTPGRVSWLVHADRFHRHPSRAFQLSLWRRETTLPARSSSRRVPEHRTRVLPPGKRRAALGRSVTATSHTTFPSASYSTTLSSWLWGISRRPLGRTS